VIKLIWLKINRYFVNPLLHFYWRQSRGMTLGVRAIVINSQNEVFMIKHSYAPGWGLPGGGVEVGETFDQALHKELREEGNITDVNPEFFALYLNNHTSNRDHVALYIVRDFKQNTPPKPNAEIIAHRWVSLDNLPVDTMRGVKARLDEYKRLTAISPYW
jgi:8-oxo-dGTP pyrophosphatase MutT (NUDIX family)